MLLLLCSSYPIIHYLCVYFTDSFHLCNHSIISFIFKFENSGIRFIVDIFKYFSYYCINHIIKQHQLSDLVHILAI